MHGDLPTFSSFVLHIDEIFIDSAHYCYKSLCLVVVTQTIITAYHHNSSDVIFYHIMVGSVHRFSATLLIFSNKYIMQTMFIFVQQTSFAVTKAKKKE